MNNTVKGLLISLAVVSVLLVSGCIGLGPGTINKNLNNTNNPNGTPGNLSANTMKFLDILGYKVSKITDLGELYLLNGSINGKDLPMYITKDEKLFMPTQYTKHINWKKIENESINYVKTIVKPGVDIAYEGNGEKRYGLDSINMQLSYMGQKIEFPLLFAFNKSLVLPMLYGIKMFEPNKTEKPNLDLFVMSFCPYGRLAEVSTSPIKDMFDKTANITVHYVLYPKEMYQGREDKYCIGNYCSMHGVNEVKEDTRQLCMQKYYPNKFWDYIGQIASNFTYSADTINETWKPLAENLGMNTTKIEECAENEGQQMLENEQQLDKKYGVSGSPTFIINGEKWGLSRTPEGIRWALCQAFKNKPSECEGEMNATQSQAAPTGSCG